jgi:hypothetical protein
MLEDIGTFLVELGIAILKLLLTVLNWLWDSIIVLLEVTLIWVADAIFGLLGILLVWLFNTILKLILALYNWSATIPGLQLAVIIFAIIIWFGWKLYSERQGQRKPDEHDE